MTLGTPAPAPAAAPAHTDAALVAVKSRDAVKHRDADHTRQLLLHAARRRFALDGYAATTVRDIAADAGVNMALINRYFTSKEGLFEACLARAMKEFEVRDPGDQTIDQMMQTMIGRVADATTSEHPLQLLLLLRSSADEAADRIRRNTIRHFAERMAEIAGWTPDDADGDQLLFRAQIALATAFGIVALRASSGLEPLTSATEAQLAGPIGDVVRSLLAP